MTDEIVVRLAEVDEQPELQALQQRAAMADDEYRRAVLKHHWKMQLQVELIRRGQVLVAEMQGSIAGLATVTPSEHENIELESVFVEPALWRRGIGRKLVEQCAELRDKLVPSLWSCSQGFRRNSFISRVGSRRWHR